MQTDQLTSDSVFGLKPLARRIVWGFRGKKLHFERQLTKWRSIWKHPRERRRRVELARALKAEAAVVAKLKRSGFMDYTSRLDQSRFAELQREVPNWGSRQSASKDFFQILSGEEGQHINNPAIQLALDPKLVALVSGYFDELPYLLSVELIKSTRTESAPNWKKSQLWHKDNNDSKVLKLFIYLNDVDGSNGPFTFVPAEHEAQHRLSYYPVHKSDEAVAKMIGANAFREIKGRAGTAFLIDTALLLHRGSRIATDHHRLAYVATYTSFAQYVPRQNNIKFDEDVSEIERLLLSNCF